MFILSTFRIERQAMYEAIAIQRIRAMLRECIIFMRRPMNTLAIHILTRVLNDTRRRYLPVRINKDIKHIARERVRDNAHPAFPKILIRFKFKIT